LIGVAAAPGNRTVMGNMCRQARTTGHVFVEVVAKQRVVRLAVWMREVEGREKVAAFATGLDEETGLVPATAVDTTEAVDVVAGPRRRLVEECRRVQLRSTEFGMDPPVIVIVVFEEVS
jgi:hypothetical protein